MRAPRRGHRLWSVPLAVIGFLPMIAVVGSSFVPSTALIDKRDCVAAERAADDTVTCTRYGPHEAVKYAVVPADAEPAGPRLSVEGLKQYDSTDHILFVTVREADLRLFEWFLARHNPGRTGFLSYADVYGTVTPDEDRDIAFRDMRDAKRDAFYVGLAKLGYPVSLLPGAAVIQQLTCLAQDDAGTCTKRTPAADVLQANDELVSLDGQPVTTRDDVGPIITKHAIGDTIAVEFKRNGTQMSGTVSLVADTADAARPIIGVLLADSRTVKIPDDVKINFQTEGIGGPSAGLSFTLTLIDELSAGDLTGGKRVAVTGTIDVEGNVGAIGGLRSKASAVRQAGAKYMIVPFSQGPEDIAAAQKAAGSGVEIIPVKTLDEALAALQRLGGDPLVKPLEATTPSS